MNIAPALSSVALTIPLSVTQGSTIAKVATTNSSSTNLTALPTVTPAPSAAPTHIPEQSSVAVPITGPVTSSEPSVSIEEASESGSQPTRVVSASSDDRQSAEENPAVASRASVQIVQGADAERGSSDTGLTEEEFLQIVELAAIDQDVRAHEQAHKSVGGQYTGAVSYSYQSGPDGKRYAIGGEVPIDASPISGDPLATIGKMRTVIAAARAPADPSPQDIKVASMAAQHLARAQIEMSMQKREQLGGSSETSEKAAQRENVVNAYQEITGLGETEKALVDELA